MWYHWILWQVHAAGPTHYELDTEHLFELCFEKAQRKGVVQ